MYLQVKIPENGTRNVFSDEQPTNQLPLFFFDVKVLTQWCKSHLHSPKITKESTVYVFRA